jgi:hypothetical protein
MTYRKDKFTVGDEVEWDEMYAQSSMREKYGHGPFTIKKVIDRNFYNNDDWMCGRQSNWDSMGHTQHVCITDDDENQFSGAFFRKITNCIAPLTGPPASR